MYQLARGMGLTPGVDWFYPSFQSFGCPAPYINPLTGARVGGVSAAFCGTRAASSARVNMNNTAIPGMRAGHALDLLYLAFPKTDTLKLAQFITGGINPINIVLRQRPTFVTIEVGGNDALGAASNADTTLLTTAAAFDASIKAIRDSLNTLNPRPKVAIATTPNPLMVPHWTKASVLFCLKTGACGIPATLPYSSPLFTVDASCAPNAAGGVGDGFLIPLATTAAITQVLAASRAAKVDCARDSVLVAVAAAPAPATANAGLRLNVPVTAAITARGAAFNAAITALATAEGWALADVYTAHTAQSANIPAIPNFANQLALFACPAAGCSTGTVTIYSQDGVHFSKAGYRMMAVAFQTAINTTYGTTIAVP
jgi:lysophospholipase L1-like esterase